ncbi:hypothetical protein [uncultured Draconibacterium sp.]|uniref:hypothetical protein n=1 Tax=uncultured Draconibacterium sp. TaxID=1573823 RepID=UPI003261311B
MAQSREAAIEALLKAGFEQTEIARILRLSENTVSKYSNKKGIKKRILEQSIKQNTAEEDALTSLAHQSKVVRMISEKLAENLSDDMTLDELKQSLIPKGEIDALQKLFTTIKRKELEWSDKVKILRQFTSFLKDEDMELARDIIPHVEVYINLLRK